LLNPPKDDDRASVKLQEATDFYIRVLSDGQELLSTEVDKRLNDAGIAFKTADRAREVPGVKHRKETGKGGRWTVFPPTSLTNSAATDQLDLHGELGEVDEVTDEDFVVRPLEV
jgi:hypothetical protein